MEKKIMLKITLSILLSIVFYRGYKKKLVLLH